MISTFLRFQKNFSTKATITASSIDLFGRPFPPKKGAYYVPSLTTDAIVIKNLPSKSSHEVLMITRKGPPFQDCLAFPGGYVDYNEDPKVACLRELLEETGIKGNSCQLFTVRGQPDRDPREHIVSIFYKVEVEDNVTPIAADDAKKAEFYDINTLLSNHDLTIAFDHKQVLLDLVKELNSKKE